VGSGYDCGSSGLDVRRVSYESRFDIVFVLSFSFAQGRRWRDYFCEGGARDVECQQQDEEHSPRMKCVERGNDERCTDTKRCKRFTSVRTN